MNGTELAAHVADPCRLAALRAVALLDTPTEEAFDRLTRLAARIVAAPIALVSLIDENRQFFKSCLGLPEPWQSRRETPLTHSFCKHNRVPNTPLVINDARDTPIFKDNPAIRDLNVIAYLGIPLVSPDGYVLGSFCVIDTKPRHWTPNDVEIVRSLAAFVMTEVNLRTEVATRKRVAEQLAQQNEELQQAYHDLERESAQRVAALELLRQREAMLVQQNRMAAMGEMIRNIAHQWRQPLNLLALLAQDLPATSAAGGCSTEYLKSQVARMMGVIAHLSKTIDDFREFYRSDKEKVAFKVVEAVERSLALLDLNLESGRIATSVLAHAQPVVEGFPNEYLQVLLNILINARDAFNEKQVADPAIVIEIGVEGERSLVTITDNGGGIPDQIIGHIFDPYFTTKTAGKGTGIGLYMSKMIVEQHMGGSLTVSNAAGGARFRIVV